MANPFLVLGGIAVGIITATFGVLAVPGWVASAQDASAKNDISQISIGQAASLSTTGKVQTSVANINLDAKVGVTVTTQAAPTKIFIDTNSETTGANQNKDYLVVVRSESGKYFARLNGGPIVEGTDSASLSTAIGTRPANITLPLAAFFA